MTIRPFRKEVPRLTTEYIDELIRRAVEGDNAAFEMIVKQYENKVYNLALRYLKNADDAMDVSQDVFLQVYRNLGKFRGDSQFSTWIYRVTYNKCVDSLRTIQKKRKSIALSIDDEDFFETPQLKNSLEQDYEVHARLAEVMNAIDQLPPEQRDLMILRYIKDLSYAQIAEILDIAEGTVKSRLNRARIKIKELCDHDGTKTEGK